MTLTMTGLKDPRERTRRYMNLDSHRPTEWFRFVNEKDSSGKTTGAKIYIYDRIGGNFWGEGTTAQGFIDQLNELGDVDIELHLNSPGGDAFEGIAIKNALRQHLGNVHVIVDGLAASAASIVAMGADTITMEESSQLMIHNSSGIVLGNKNDMREMADLMDQLDGNIAEVYLNRAGGTLDEWKSAMDDESWYTASEAVKAGLADDAKKGKKNDKPQNNWDLSVYMYAGREHAPAPKMFNIVKEPGVTAPNNTQTGAQPPTPPAPPALPQPPAPPVAPVAQPATFVFSYDGKTSTDPTAVQAHLTLMENENKVLRDFKKEQLEAGRKNFINGLAQGDAPKIAATQVDALTELALGMTDEQYNKFKASYEGLPAAPLFAAHGQTQGGAGTDPANDAAAKANDELEIAREIVAQHRLSNMSEEHLKNTDSYKTMVRLEAATATQAK